MHFKRYTRIDSELMERSIELAKTLASQGSAVAAISIKLRQAGLGAYEAEILAIEAVYRSVWWERFKGIGLLVCGLMLFCTSLFLTRVDCDAVIWSYVLKVAVTVGFFGVFAIALGVTRIFQRGRLSEANLEKYRLR